MHLLSESSFHYHATCVNTEKRYRIPCVCVCVSTCMSLCVHVCLHVCVCVYGWDYTGAKHTKLEDSPSAVDVDVADGSGDSSRLSQNSLHWLNMFLYSSSGRVSAKGCPQGGQGLLQIHVSGGKDLGGKIWETLL